MDCARTHSTTRRGFVRLAGLGTAALATGGAVGFANRAEGAAADSPQAALSQYFSARAAASDAGRAAILSAPASGAVLKFERERASSLRSLGQRLDWDGTIRRLSSSADLVEVADQSPTSVVLRAYDVTTIDWVPRPRTPDLTPEERRLRAAEPARYGVGTKPGTPVRSGIGTQHELRLERGSTGWVVVSDAYVEPVLFGDSPDVPASPYIRTLSRMADPRPLASGDGPSPSADSELIATTGTAAASGTYNWQVAVNYAAAYWSDYNATYVNYNTCGGGDCANFVSQCFFRGGQKPDVHWGREIGPQCGYTGRYRGTGLQWYNNWNLRNWVINQSRGYDCPGINSLGSGDIVNYSWDQNGSFDHVAIMTNPTNNLVSAHNTNHYNVPWQLGDSSAGHRFTHMWLQYPG